MNIYLTAAATLLAATVPFPADARPLTPEDLQGFNRIGGAALSPDSNLLVFSMRETDFEADKGRTDLFTLDLTDRKAAPVRWQADPESDGDPVFSVNGEMLYWLSGRSGDAQVWRAPVTGGAAEQVTAIEGGIAGFHLSPTNDHIAYWKDVVPDGEAIGDGRVYDRLFVRHWDSWSEGERSQLFTLGLSDGAEPVAITANLDGDVPDKPFGDGGDVAFSADGQTLFFVLREKGDTEPWSTDLDIWSAPVDGRAAPTNLTDGDDGTDSKPTPSPDGKFLAYASMARAGYESDRLTLKVRDLATGDVRTVAPDWDRSAGSIDWMPDGNGLVVGASDGWNRLIYGVPFEGEVFTILSQPGSNQFVASSAEKMFYLNSSLTEPGDLYVRSADGTSQLTSVNADKMKDIELGEVSRFSFAGANDDEVFGYVVKPVGLAEDAEAPTVLWAHGGPQGNWANSWSSRWNPQAWAGAGYAIVTVDFHGSTGYGQQFTDSINNDWGGKPLEDLQKGLAAARAEFPFLNDEKACAAGGSYGGYMMNWIEGAWPDGMDCLVNHAGLFDMRSFYYSTEELWFPEWDFGGPYYERSEAYENWNPATKVEDWKTPMLVIHGLKDYRVPYTQGLMAFTALQRRGIESRMLVFDDENHWILSPNNNLQWHDEIFRWLDAHLKD
ncbi:MAG: S9 family peptidase [Pacificimonas sp.]